MNDNIEPRKPLDDPCWSEADLGIDEDKHITVVAVIDDGLPFAHRNFRDREGKTRVEFCWLQSVECDKTQKTVLFGRE